MMGLLWSVHFKNFGFVGLVLWAWFFWVCLLFFCDRFSLIWFGSFGVVSFVCKVRFCRYDLVGFVVVGRFVLVGMIK